MNELDLIPQDYRDKLEQRAIFRRYVIAFAVLNILVLAFGGLFMQLTKNTTGRIQELQTQNAITEQQRVQLEALTADQSDFERRWSLLRGLRAGAAIEDIFTIVDEALTGNGLWFVNWSFRRAGVVIDGETRTVEAGYFLIVPSDEQPAETPEWRVETHMVLEGRAIDHQALSTFVRSLFEHPDIKDVNVRRTSLTNYGDGRVVSFDLTIILNSDAEHI